MKMVLFLTHQLHIHGIVCFPIVKNEEARLITIGSPQEDEEALTIKCGIVGVFCFNVDQNKTECEWHPFQ